MPGLNTRVLVFVSALVGTALVGAALALSTGAPAQAQQAPCNPAVQTCT